MLVFAGNDEGVEEIECDRFDPHDRITRAGAWWRGLGQRQRLRRAEMGAQNGFHAPVAPWWQTPQRTGPKTHNRECGDRKRAASAGGQGFSSRGDLGSNWIKIESLLSVQPVTTVRHSRGLPHEA